MAVAARVRPVVVLCGDDREPCVHCDVRHRSVCATIPDADLARLAAIAVVRDYAKGEVLVTEGDPADSFFNVTLGTAKLFRSLPDGRQVVTGFAGAGHFVGLAAAATYAFTAQAIEPARACRFMRGRLRRLLDDFPALEQRLLATACNDLATAQAQLLLLGRKTARERVASFLLAWSRAAAPCGPPPDRLRLPMTRGEIADHLGLTLETVSRTLGRFRAERRIALPAPWEICLLDRAWLERQAGPD